MVKGNKRRKADQIFHKINDIEVISIQLNQLRDEDMLQLRNYTPKLPKINKYYSTPFLKR